MNDVHFSLWSIWPVLPNVSKLFLLVLVFVVLYILFLAAGILSRLRVLSKQGPAADSLAVLRGRAETMRQLLAATFYLWGIIFFITLISSNPTIEGESTRTNTMRIIQVWLYSATFSADVFVVLLILHCVQWLVSNRINRTMRMPI